VKVTAVFEENVTLPLRVPSGITPDTSENDEAEKVAAPDTVPVPLCEVSLKVAALETNPLLVELPLKVASCPTVPYIALYELPLNVASLDTVSSLCELLLKVALLDTVPSLCELPSNVAS